MRIETLSVAGVAGLPDGVFSFPDTDLVSGPIAFIGPPRSGKTRLLELLVATHRAALRDPHEPPDARDWLLPDESEGLVEATFRFDDSDAGLVADGLATITWSLRRDTPTAGAEAAPGARALLGRRHRAAPKLLLLPANRSLALGVMTPRILDPALRATSRWDKHAGIRTALATDAEARGAFEEALRRLDPDVTEVIVDTEAAPGSEAVRIRRATGPLRDIAELPRSELEYVLFALVFAVIGLDRSVVLIDTPERFLSPAQAKALPGQLQNLARHVQIVMATSSPFLLSSLAAGAVQEVLAPRRPGETAAPLTAAPLDRRSPVEQEVEGAEDKASAPPSSPAPPPTLQAPSFLRAPSPPLMSTPSPLHLNSPLSSGPPPSPALRVAPDPPAAPRRGATLLGGASADKPMPFAPEDAPEDAISRAKKHAAQVQPALPPPPSHLAGTAPVDIAALARKVLAFERAKTSEPAAPASPGKTASPATRAPATVGVSPPLPASPATVGVSPPPPVSFATVIAPLTSAAPSADVTAAVAPTVAPSSANASVAAPPVPATASPSVPGALPASNPGAPGFSPASAAPGVAPPASTSTPVLTIEQYASLCVELELHPAQAAEILRRYATNLAGKRVLDEGWTRVFAEQPARRAAFEQARASYRAWLSRAEQQGRK